MAPVLDSRITPLPTFAGPPHTGALVAVALLATLLLAALPAIAQDGAQRIVHLLDYVGVDYAGAVEGGKVKSADEYQEMTEFTMQALERLNALPANPAKAALATDAALLARLVAEKAPPQAVAEASAALRWALIRAYGLQVAPRRAPDLARGNALYQIHCAACHGTDGRGDGPAAKLLDPPPANFHDAGRMSERSLYGLYNAIALGVPGTSMAAFAQLGEEDWWAMAFHVANLAATPERLKEGAAAWRSGQARLAFGDLAGVTGYSANEVLRRHGPQADLVQVYLRAHPEALAGDKPAPIAYARGKLAESLARYRGGDRIAARDAATTAYLEGFELVENSLDNVDKPLRLEIEREMLAMRAAISDGAPPDALATRIALVDALLVTAQEKLDAGALSPGGAFVTSLVILVREGLEAILLLAAIIAFVCRTGRRDALPYVHAGWIIAILAGIATWVAANTLITISGANREFTEGITALVAAAMLLYVGFWLHGKSQARAWSAFLHDNVGRALERKTLWAMSGVSFLAVYRELFELVLFYEALWIQAGAHGRGAVLGGIAVAAVLLSAAGWGLFKYSLRLPLGPFFSAMSLLVALLAIVFAGQGVAALQEAGVVDASPVQFFVLPMLGVHPTLESLGAQLLVAALVALGARGLRRESSPGGHVKS